MRSTTFLLTLLCTGMGLIAPVAAQVPTVEFAGLQMVTKSYGEGNDAIRPFQSFDDGVKLAFLLRLPAGGLISIDEKAGTITSFADDKGTQLYQKGEFKNGFGSFPSVSKDGKAASFTIEGTVPPAAGATKISAKGTVAVQTASKKETVKGGALKAGATLTAGKQKLTAKEVEKSGNDTKVSLSSDQSFDSLVEVRWLDAAGKALESDSNGSSSFGFGGKTTYSRDWTVSGVPNRVEFVLWTDLKTVQVPFSATVSIGATP
jgi:hypothetical protein